MTFVYLPLTRSLRFEAVDGHRWANVRKWRLARDVKWNALARDLGVQPSRVSGCERDRGELPENTDTASVGEGFSAVRCEVFKGSELYRGPETAHLRADLNSKIAELEAKG